MTTEKNSYQRIQEAAGMIQSRTKLKPRVGLILGSGLGSIADTMTEKVSIPYSEIPYFHPTTVAGHSGLLVIGKLSGVPAACLMGRFHAYEGYSLSDVVFPTRVLCALGIKNLILTNAAGGINTRFRPGDLMGIEDHLNLTGGSPLVGPNLSEMGPRFPDLTEAYDKESLAVLLSAARDLDIPMHVGVYAGLMGPNYETPAEVRMLRTLGADAAGMSTVAESIAANHFGIKVSGISCITNLAAGLSPQKLSHQEVLETSRLSSEKMMKVLLQAVPKLGDL